MRDYSNGGSGRELFGLIIVLVGFVLLMNTMNIFPLFPLFSLIHRFWLPALFIGIGLLLLSRRSGQDGVGGGLFFILFGVLFLIGGLNLWDFSYRKWIGPGILIWIGIAILMRSQRPRSNPAAAATEFAHRLDEPPRQDPRDRFEKSGMGPSQVTDSSDFVHATVILSAFNKRCPSQQFRGGDLTAIMGGGKLDLREAQIKDREAVLDVFTLMGGLEIQVPPGWAVEPRFTSILGGYSDRTEKGNKGNQRLVINGTAIMGGITISN
jgi:hypothetical protein